MSNYWDYYCAMLWYFICRLTTLWFAYVSFITIGFMEISCPNKFLLIFNRHFVVKVNCLNISLNSLPVLLYNWIIQNIFLFSSRLKKILFNFSLIILVERNEKNINEKVIRWRKVSFYRIMHRRSRQSKTVRLCWETGALEMRGSSWIQA